MRHCTFPVASQRCSEFDRSPMSGRKIPESTRSQRENLEIQGDSILIIDDGERIPRRRGAGDSKSLVWRFDSRPSMNSQRS
jgi:hypothetical protein